MPEPRPLEPGDPARIGGYRVTARLGSGGQGVVYLCVGPHGGEAAIKLLHPWFSGTSSARRLFDREIEAAGLVRGFAARLLASGEHEGRPYIVSEYIAGESVAERVYRDGPYGGNDLLELAAGTATALDAIHKAGLVHCDFKPANVLVGPGGARVVDFGIARALETIVDGTQDLRGTPAYMAPEQITGGPMGPSADVFAWASTLVFAATGEPPFGAQDDNLGQAVMYRIVHEEPALDDVPPPLREIASACLVKNPDLRPTARDIISMIGRPAEAPLGSQIGDPLTGHTRTIVCIAYGRMADRPIALTGSHDGTARVWDLAAGSQLGPPLQHRSAVLSVACARIDGRTVAVTGCQDRTVALWDVASGERLGGPLTGHTGAVVSIATGVLDGRPVAVSVSDDRSVLLWDLAGRRVDGPPLVRNNSVMSVACADLDGTTAVVIGGSYDQAVRILDLTDRRATGLPLTGHTNTVMSVACGTMKGRPVVITGGYDRTVRIWDPVDRKEIVPPLRHSSAVMAVAYGLRGDTPIVLSSGANRVVSVWDLHTSELMAELRLSAAGLTSSAVPVAFGELSGRPIAITGGEGLAIRVWSLGEP